MDQKQMHHYCQLIAALKIRTTNKKGRHLSTIKCIEILENYGVEIDGNITKLPEGTLKKSTVNRYLKNWGFDDKSLNIEPLVIHFEADQSNDCWQFDFTPSELKQIKDSPSGKKLMIAAIVDDKSGSAYSECYEIDGEDVMTALKFLFNAMSPKKNPDILIQGIPKMIYTDNGAFVKSALFKRVLKSLGIELVSHLPRGHDGRKTTARAKGKIERFNGVVKDQFETLYHFHEPKNIREANQWMQNYLVEHNIKKHRSENETRIEVWKHSLPSEGYRKMCSWEQFCQIARSPEERTVKSDATISVNGIAYQLSAEMAGQKVTVLHGVLDNQLHVEFENDIHGPFYPYKGPIPLHTYKKAEKMKRELQADQVSQLAKNISIPIEVLTGQDNST